MTTAEVTTPGRAPGVELLGPLPGSGYAQQQFLVRRGDGQTLQITPVLYSLLEVLERPGRPDDLASRLSARLGKQATAEDVVDLLGRLRPLGLLAGDEAEAPRKPVPLLGLRFRVVVTDPAVTRRITAPFAQLFRPWVVVPVLAAFVGVCWFVLVEKGLASATRQAFFEPEKLLAVFALVVLSAGLHEFGHAAACRYGGATPGAMGAGLYLVWPAFYTDVDDSYRLSRWGRLRVDLGGLYFNALAAVGIWGLWLAWREDALLLGVAMQLLQMLRQLPPVIRADGYHIVADLTGVPDLYRHLGPTLKKALPWHWRDSSPLRRRARWLVTGWTVVVVPMLAAMAVTGVLVLPRLVATAWAGGRVQAARLGSWDPLVMGAATLKLVALLLPVLAVGGMAVRLCRKGIARVWRATDGRPRSRRALVLAGLVALLMLLTAWWPRGQYEPVHAVEKTPLPAATKAAQHDRVVAMALVPREKDKPTLLVLPGEDQPRAVLTSTAAGGGTAAGTAFPFSLPDAPGPGDNQALAVGDEDGRTVYDVAYAVVTVTDGAPVTSSNEAYALASCTGCTTVAVAFQVVLVVGQTDAVVPVNAAVAGNSGCIRCVTAALAVQLVVTVSELPSQQVYDDLQAALSELDGLEDLPLDQLWPAVQQVQQEVAAVLVEAGLAPDLVVATAAATASPAVTAAASASAVPTQEPGGTPTPTAESQASAEPTPSTTTPTPEPSLSP